MEVSVKCEARHICIRLSGELDHHSAKGSCGGWIRRLRRPCLHS